MGQDATLTTPWGRSTVLRWRIDLHESEKIHPSSQVTSGHCTQIVWHWSHTPHHTKLPPTFTFIPDSFSPPGLQKALSPQYSQGNVLLGSRILSKHTYYSKSWCLPMYFIDEIWHLLFKVFALEYSIKLMKSPHWNASKVGISVHAALVLRSS